MYQRDQKFFEISEAEDKRGEETMKPAPGDLLVATKRSMFSSKGEIEEQANLA